MDCPIGFFITRQHGVTTAQPAMFPDDLHGIGLDGPHVMKVDLGGGNVLVVTAMTAGTGGYPPYAAVTIVLEAGAENAPQ